MTRLFDSYSIYIENIFVAEAFLELDHGHQQPKPVYYGSGIAGAGPTFVYDEPAEPKLKLLWVYPVKNSRLFQHSFTFTLMAKCENHKFMDDLVALVHLEQLNDVFGLFRVWNMQGSLGPDVVLSMNEATGSFIYTPVKVATMEEMPEILEYDN